uniref:Uncharacterized protein n=1 Tax=Magallana gigas TaxID=29159 RepID=A0A8W8J140_MAGGI
MAESFFNSRNQQRTSSPSRNLEDFEEEWLQIGRDFSVLFDSGNSPVDPDQIQSTDGSKRRKLSEAEDSFIISRRKMARQSEGFFAGDESRKPKQKRPLQVQNA